ncbi:MAG: S41 family peptidase [Bacillota bacterium]
MQKKKFIAIILVVILLTSISTLTLANFLEIPLGSTIIISKNEYYDLKSLEKRYSKIDKLRKNIKEEFYKEVDSDKLNNGLLHGLFKGLDDPYSVYMSKEEYKDFNEMNSGSYGGIGVIVSPDDDNLINIVSPIANTPGDEAGLKSGDKILEANGIKVYADKMDKAIDIMKGKPDTEVELKIKRGNETFNVKIIRENIVLKSVKSKVVGENLGYLRINMFDQKVSDEFNQNLNKLLDKEVNGLIIDLRNNPGGSLREVIEIADRLLGKNLIVYTKDRKGNKREFSSDSNKIDLPITVLVNEGSASASEILTGAIKDLSAGTIIGHKTFGKGIVQSVIEVGDGTAYKLTTSQYFTPNGNYIHNKGIEPDIKVDLPKDVYFSENLDITKDTQLKKAIEILNKK